MAPKLSKEREEYTVTYRPKRAKEDYMIVSKSGNPSFRSKKEALEAFRKLKENNKKIESFLVRDLSE